MESMDVFLNSSAGLLAAIGIFLSGIAALIKAILDMRQNKLGDITNHTKLKRAPIIKGMLLLSVICFLLSGSIFAVRSTETLAVSDNASLTNAAWEAFNKKDYETAIAKAQECITAFKGSADRSQSELIRQNKPLPPFGSVLEYERRAILSRGPLNDVATCYFIIGQSAEFQGLRDIAREAYTHAAFYRYARTWDTRGWFWSPAESASDHLINLR